MIFLIIKEPIKQKKKKKPHQKPKERRAKGMDSYEAEIQTHLYHSKSISFKRRVEINLTKAAKV